jgi:hypothetical protein
MLMNFAISWTNYRLDTLVVTNRRIIDIDQLGLFARNISELRLENIEDITIDIPGFIASWLNYGDIVLQTAAEQDKFTFRGISHPEAAKNFISERSEEHIRELHTEGNPANKVNGMA